jgi:uncharacterized BrkB/YihY/UPF0761 family membrane protein
VSAVFFAALAWLAISILFSWYLANFGHYDATYGPPELPSAS